MRRSLAAFAVVALAALAAGAAATPAAVARPAAARAPTRSSTTATTASTSGSRRAGTSPSPTGSSSCTRTPPARSSPSSTRRCSRRARRPASFFRSPLAALKKDVAGRRERDVVPHDRRDDGVAHRPGRDDPGRRPGAGLGRPVPDARTARSSPSSPRTGRRRRSSPALRPALAGIGACYGPEAGTLFRIFKDPAFTYPLPPGWRVQECPDQLSAIDGKLGSATYVFSQAVPQSTTGVTDVKSYAPVHARPARREGGPVLSTLGRAEPDDGHRRGPAVRGDRVPRLERRHPDPRVAGVQATSGGGVTSGTVRLAMSTRPQWNALNQALLRVASGIQHDFTQDDQELLHVQQQLQGFAQQVAGFDQALNGTDIVQTRRRARRSRRRTARTARAARTAPATTRARTGNL